MSVPRQILPGTTYLLTRRCAQRQFLLRPSRKVNQIVRFCLAYAAQRFAIRLHAYITMSNHMHIVATDIHGNLPEFMHWLNEYVAKCVNAHLGRWESFWAPGSYSAVRLIDPEDVLAKMVYVYTNAVDAGLVRSARDWPGAKSLTEDLLRPPVEIRRPREFFRKNGPVPEKVLLRLDVPDALVETAEDPVDRLARAVEAREKEIRSARREHGLGFLGRRRALKQSPFRRPRSSEPRRGLDPGVAAADKWHRIEVTQRLKAFRNAYREARQRYLKGDSSVLFPWGTYWMHVRLGVQCCGP
jgi:REP element-mobilizing transposase RayT